MGGAVGGVAGLEGGEGEAEVFEGGGPVRAGGQGGNAVADADALEAEAEDFGIDGRVDANGRKVVPIEPGIIVLQLVPGVVEEPAPALAGDGVVETGVQ